jgi:hypothetical protein
VAGPLRVARRAEQPIIGPAAGLPARLRSLLASTWGKRPEPRVRYGQPFLPGLAGLGRSRLGAARALLERAEAVRARRFTHLGLTVGFPGRIDWCPRGLSEAWVIALNSLDDVFSLGVAAALAPTPEVRRGWFEAASGLVREWMSGAPDGRGASWALQALVRRIPSLIYLHTFFPAELRADPALRRTLLVSLYGQAAALAAAAPAGAPDATVVAAGRALFMAGRFFDGMEARGWLEAGGGILWRELREQIHDDGGHASRNPAVHALVLADYLEVLAVLQASNDDVPIWARKRVKGMADFLARVLHPDGEIALFHGAGIGLARSARDLLALAAMVLHEPACALPGDLGLWPLLVGGEPGQRVHANLARRSPVAEARALRRTGFYVLPGGPGDVMVLDGASRPAGGDAGVFGYELSVGGMRLVVDSGCAQGEEGAWAEYFRSTRAHNVVSVGGAEQGTAARAPEVTGLQWVVRDGLVYFAGTHDGFWASAGAGLGVRHRRHVFCLPARFWVVCDQVLGTGTWDVESFVHLHPDVTLRAACQGRVALQIARSDDAALTLVSAGADEVHVAHGVEILRPQGWYAARPGERRPAPVVSLVAEARLPHVFGYALLPRAEGPASLRLEHDAFHVHATLRVGGAEYVVTVVQGDVEMRIRSV